MIKRIRCLGPAGIKVDPTPPPLPYRLNIKLATSSLDARLRPIAPPDTRFRDGRHLTWEAPEATMSSRLVPRTRWRYHAGTMFGTTNPADRAILIYAVSSDAMPIQDLDQYSYNMQQINCRGWTACRRSTSPASEIPAVA